MIQKIIYFVIQFSILTIPPVWATYMFQINDYIDNPFTEYLGYIGGVSGFFCVGLPAEIASNFIPETLSSIIFIFVFLAISYFVFLKFYIATLDRIAIVSVVNGWIVVWSVAFGTSGCFWQRSDA